jgi:hypothetical protein
MTPLVISAVQWSRLRDIDDVEPIHEGDTTCLADIRDVLKKHGKLERFGVALLHSHFELADDEILLESTNVDARRLVTEPVKESDADQSNIGTIWMLREGDHETMSWCRQYCKRLPISNSHDKGHTREK